jgi:hypothetical protein
MPDVIGLASLNYGHFNNIRKQRTLPAQFLGSSDRSSNPFKTLHFFSLILILGGGRIFDFCFLLFITCVFGWQAINEELSVCLCVCV